MYTGFGALVGTLAHMAPEQATFNQLDVDTRADMYALGVLLYELLAGSPPVEPARLQTAALDGMLRIVREEDPPRPSQRLSTTEALPTLAACRGTEPRRLAALVRGELDWIAMKALDKYRNRRYERAAGFAADVQRYLAGEPVPPSAGYRARKFLRNNRGPVTAAALVVLALVGGVVGATVGLLRAQAARQAEVRGGHAAGDGAGSPGVPAAGGGGRSSKGKGTSSRRRPRPCGASLWRGRGGGWRRSAGGQRRQEEIDPDAPAAPGPDEELPALNEALDRLAEVHPDKAQLVKLRYFAGLTADGAAALGVSPSTVERHWAYARAWLRRAMGVGEGAGG